MAKIFYAVSGEGRGHATRARTLIESLKADHRIVLYAPHHAHDVLDPVYRDDPEVTVRRIPGLTFHYSAHDSAARRLDYFQTGGHGLAYLARLPRRVRELERELRRERPDLVVTDFEPLLPRAARRVGVPFVSLDHQHFLTTYDLSSLPLGLRLHAELMSWLVRLFYRGQAATVVSSFYFPPLRRGVRNVRQIGVLLRPEILGAEPEEGPHLLAYLRRFESPRVIEALRGCGCPVRVYGLGERPDAGRLRFCAVDVERFAADLARCRGLVTTAGNQLIGEALYLGKPVLAVPERGNREQEVNAHFLRRSGAGMVTDMDRLTAADVRALLDGADRLVSRIDRRRLCGNPAALEVIRGHLPEARRSRLFPLPIPA
jgi:uncharacterized protein (TIGR00661 family)